MIITIIIHELRHNFLNMRFYVMLLLTVFIFGIGTVTFIHNYEKRVDNYLQDEASQIENMKELAGQNATRLAIARQSFVTKPRPNSFISESREKYIPKLIKNDKYSIKCCQCW